MSIVNRVLALLKMEVSELIREASITDSISPRSPGTEPKIKVKEDYSAINHRESEAPTVGHEVHHQFGICDVGAAYSGSTVPFTFCWVYTSNHIWIEMEKISLMARQTTAVKSRKPNTPV